MASKRKPSETDIQYLKRLQKRANERLRKLEKSTRSGIRNFAYRKAMYMIKKTQGGGTRFNLSGIKKSKGGKYLKSSVIRGIKDVEKFLKMKSSTEAGYKRTIEKRTNKLNSKYGVNLSPQQWDGVLSSKAWAKAVDKYGSEMVMAAIAISKDKGFESIKKDIASRKRRATRSKTDIELPIYDIEDEIANEIIYNIFNDRSIRKLFEN